MNDGLNYNDICCMETIYFIMFGQKVPGGIHKITASAGCLEFVPGGSTCHRPAWLHPWRDITFAQEYRLMYVIYWYIKRSTGQPFQN